jgi:hypothetical protein
MLSIGRSTGIQLASRWLPAASVRVGRCASQLLHDLLAGITATPDPAVP